MKKPIAHILECIYFAVSVLYILFEVAVFLFE